LRAAGAQAEQPAELKLREAVFNEGPAGVANAVKNLWRNIGAYTGSLFSYLFTRGDTGVVGRTDTGEPITGRDLIALLATIGIDLGLLALAIVNPPREPPSIRPSGALSRQINAAIDTAIARANVTRDWVQGHFIHHKRASYLVIPNLYSCDPNDESEKSRGLAMNQLAGVLSDLGLVRWPERANKWTFKKSELDILKEEEAHTSTTDLHEIRKKWVEENKVDPKILETHSKDVIRNHGLFSKAERALEIAGWSQKAREDIEVFTLVESEGLTPLLMVLNERPDVHYPEGSKIPAKATA